MMMMAKIEPEEQVDCVNEEPDAEEGNVAGGLKDGGVDDDEYIDDDDVNEESDAEGGNEAPASTTATISTMKPLKCFVTLTTYKT